MDTALLARLLGLRYRLLWAQVRTGTGRMALFAVGYVLLMLIGMLVAGTGLLVGSAGAQMGTADVVARAALGVVFLWAIAASVLFGFSVNAAFSDAALRRYALTALGRDVARHAAALLDPLWLLVLALNVGLATGLWLSGLSRPWVGLPAAVVLVVTNYLMARVLMDAVDRALGTWIGRLLLAVLGLLLGFVLPALSTAAGPVRSAALGGLSAVLRLTPPGTAARAMVGGGGLGPLAWLGLLFAWCAGLGLALVALERHPLAPRTQPRGRATWNGPCDRVAALCGQGLAPLVSKQLRYHLRSAHLRWNYPLAIPMLAWVAHTALKGVPDGQPMAPFLAVLGALPALGICTGGLTPNVFGADGAGFRRYFLLPVPPARVLLAAALVGLLFGLSLLPVALLAWAVYRPHLTDLRLVSMLVCSGVGGLLAYQALGLWSSLLAPKAMPLGMKFGNRLSWAGTLVFALNMMTLFFGPVAAVHWGGPLLRHGWVLPLFALAAAAFFAFSLAAGGRLLVRRRERMLSTLDVGSLGKGG